MIRVRVPRVVDRERVPLHVPVGDVRVKALGDLNGVKGHARVPVARGRQVTVAAMMLREAKEILAVVKGLAVQAKVVPSLPVVIVRLTVAARDVRE